jgi:glycine/D-amino acid oxidase-like deaminating enzyme
MNGRAEGTISPWMQVEVLPDANRLEGDHRADVVVVGSGIAGLSAAYELSAAGHRVVVVDRGAIAGGMTARTTAHLAPVCDDGVGSLTDLRGQDMARLFHESQAAAVDRVEAITRELGIDCDLRRLDGFLFPALHMDREAAREAVVREHRAAREAGLAVDHARGVPFEGLADVPALRYPRQATFHPLKYAAALARAVQANGACSWPTAP